MLPLLARFAGIDVANSLQEEIEALNFFFVFRAEHAVARRTQLLRVGTSQQFAPILAIWRAVDHSVCRHLTQGAQQVLAAIYFTGINQHHCIVVVERKLYYQRGDPVGAVYPSHILPGNDLFADFEMGVIHLDRGPECQNQ